MSVPSKIVALRLPSQMAERLQRLTDNFDLPPSTVLKMLIGSQLEKSLDDQIEIVTAQILKPGQKIKTAVSRVPENTRREHR